MENFDILDVKKKSEQLIDDVKRLSLDLSQNDTVKIAAMIANKLQDNTPIYTGALNPVWRFYGNVALDLSRRIMPD